MVVLCNTALTTETDVDNAYFNAGIDILRYSASTSGTSAQSQSQGPAPPSSGPSGVRRPDPRLRD